MQKFAKEWLEIENEFGIFKEDVNTQNAEHTHDFLEMIYVLSGTVCQHVNGNVYEMKKGSLLFINYEQVHSFEGSDDYTFVNFMLKPDFISNTLLDEGNSFELLSLSMFDEFKDKVDSFSPAVNFSGSEILSVEHIITLMLDEYKNRNPGCKTVLGSCMKVIFTLFVRKMCNTEYGQIMHYVNKITPDILRYIDDNCFDKLSIKQLAEKCFYSPVYFSRMFKNAYGMNLKSYIKEKRMEEAIRLLETTDESIEKICHLVGYSDKKQFYNIFKEYTGKLPGDIRKR